MMSPKQIRDQEQQAFVWIVGRMASFSTGLLHIPALPKEPFQSALGSFNEKVQNKLDYYTWRSKIYNKVRYIRSRSKMGKNAPWYKSYFMHLLGASRRGLKYADEPDDYVPPTTPAKKRKLSMEVFEVEELGKTANRKQPKRLTIEYPASD